MYLTESQLGNVLENIIFPGKTFVRNKTVPNSGIKNKPDFRNDDLMLIVEFNGDKHYTTSKVQYNDNVKKAVYEELGYTVVEIPYFIQLSSETIKYYFNVDVNYNKEFTHGFIGSEATLPADFNTLGIRRFRNEMFAIYEECENVFTDVMSTLLDKVVDNSYKDSIDFTVLPLSVDAFEYELALDIVGDLMDEDSLDHIEEMI